MNKDLTVGNPGSVLWRFTFPLFISVIFQQFYNIADSIIAGKFAGEEALAAVGASYPITMIFMAIALGSNMGCSVVISQLFGGKKLRDMKTAVSTSIIASIVLSVILSVVGLCFSTTLMKLVKTPLNIMDDGRAYLQIYIAGFIFVFLYNVCTGLFQALGDSKTPLYFLIASSIGNVVLDYIFVAIFHWGVRGVAWATFLAQGVACILSCIVLGKRMKEIRVENYSKFSMTMVKKISFIAIPTILQQSFISVGNIFVQGVINSFGSSVIAGYSAAMKLNTFTITTFTTVGSGISSFSAQNVGAGKLERVKDGLFAGLKISMILAIPFFVCYYFLGQSFLNLFMEDNSVLALETGGQFLKIVAPFYFIIAIKLTVDGMLKGTGRMKLFMISTFSDLLLRVILAYVLSSPLGTAGIWWSWPIGWCLSTSMYIILFLQGKLIQKEYR